jgi:glycerol transport system substrate-binding protein
MAGNGDRGLPNGRPVDEWGIRAENGIPVGSSISRGGDANGPAAVYALTKFVEWLKKYAPPEAAGMDFLEEGACQAMATSPSRSSGIAPSLPRSPSLIFR